MRVPTCGSSISTCHSRPRLQIRLPLANCGCCPSPTVSQFQTWNLTICDVCIRQILHQLGLTPVVVLKVLIYHVIHWMEAWLVPLGSMQCATCRSLNLNVIHNALSSIQITLQGSSGIQSSGVIRNDILTLRGSLPSVLVLEDWFNLEHT